MSSSTLKNAATLLMNVLGNAFNVTVDLIRIHLIHLEIGQDAQQVSCHVDIAQHIDMVGTLRSTPQRIVHRKFRLVEIFAGRHSHVGGIETGIGPLVGVGTQISQGQQGYRSIPITVFNSPCHVFICFGNIGIQNEGRFL